MNISCQDRERIFLDGSAEEWAALEQHAAGCAACAQELAAWKLLSVAAGELRDYQPNSALWARIGRIQSPAGVLATAVGGLADSVGRRCGIDPCGFRCVPLHPSSA
jgi:hypothetical protein